MNVRTLEERLGALIESLKLAPEQREEIEHFVSEALAIHSPTIMLQPDVRTAETLYEACDIEAVSLPYHTAPGASTDSREASPLELPEKYLYGGRIGEGGVGEVHRIRDRELNRWMVLKVLKSSANTSHLQLAQFIEEAQVTAQLSHPGVVAVHELGRLNDGRLYFTMREVRGQTLADIIEDAQEQDPRSWSHARWNEQLMTLVGHFQRVCETIAYAHERGVIHRDLKPENIMVGSFGQVYVMDWGLAWILDDAPGASKAPEEINAYITPEMRAQMRGQLAGTPAYMSPEQIRGDTARFAPQTDVYALGAVLYEILTGRPPYEGDSPMSILVKVLKDEPPPAREVFSRWLTEQAGVQAQTIALPELLFGVCQKAMARDLEERYEDAGAMLLDIQQWLTGSHRRQQAMALMDKAMALQPQQIALKEKVGQLQREIDRIKETLPTWTPLEALKPLWDMERRHQEGVSELEALSSTLLSHLRSSLVHDPDLPEAHALLAEHHKQAHETMAARDSAAARRELSLLSFHDKAGLHSRYIKGHGALTLVTDPPGAEATLFRYEERERRHVLTLHQHLGATPHQHLSLRMGRYMVSLSAEGRHDVRYPIDIERLRHWNGIRPGSAEPAPIRMPALGELAEDDILVPGGRFLTGGNGEMWCHEPQELWVDAFIIKKHPVTQAQYLTFINDLIAQGRHEEAQRHMPGTSIFGKDVFNIRYTQDADGFYHLDKSCVTMLAENDWPIVRVNWHNAMAYSRWYAEQQGRPWRLPFDLEWEKAARGTDGRTFPWGDDWNYLNANVHGSRKGGDIIVSIYDSPRDESPYGVRNLAGNVRDWTQDAFAEFAPPCHQGLYTPQLPHDSAEDFPVCIRGGAWFSMPNSSILFMRYRVGANVHSNALGFRLARPLHDAP